MLDVLIVGNGFSGINVAKELLDRGLTNFEIVDRGDDFGGTWRDNTYPGAECDIQSHLYSFSFRPNPNWSKTYAPQQEILDYLRTVATELGLREYSRFGEQVLEAKFSLERESWTVQTSKRSIEARYLVLGTGHLADPKLPDAEGVSEFGGEIFHSARWNHDIDLSGKSVAVVGTGASAIQVVPMIASQDTQVTVFQRTAPYVIPRMDSPYSDAEKRTFARHPEVMRRKRDFLFWSNESRFLQRMMVEEDLHRMESIARVHREAQLGDRTDLLEAVTPDYTIGCKRILLSNTWYPSLTQSNVSLVSAGVSRFSESGVIDANGDSHAFDVVILCSGFEAQNLPIADLVENQGGVRLADQWKLGSRAYGGMLVNGFPNMFLINGPHVGLGAGSIISMVEAQASYIASTIAALEVGGSSVSEVSVLAQDEFVRHIQARSEGTVWTSGGCKSWYVSDETGELTAIWPDMMNRFRSMFSDAEVSKLTVVR